ncbi:hypothetical protein CHUAL_013675 [Chamberlinius hualienensis]
MWQGYRQHQIISCINVHCQRTLTYDVNCPSEVLHVVFLKTHKTGGSSVQNMLMRFGNSRNLTFVLPPNNNYLGHPEPFEKKMAMQLKDNFEYNILTHHTRYDRSELSITMPTNTKYITLLRNPVTLFESLYSYYYIENELNMTLDEFVKMDDSEKTREVRNKRLHGGKIGRNQMSFDLGMEIKNFDKLIQAQLFAEQLNNDFDLVMIAERLPESLILLKHLMCWSTIDIVIFNHNSRQDKFKKTITIELATGIQYWNAADKYLYDYFCAILDRKTEEFGAEKMIEELKELREVTDYWYDYCVVSKATNNNLTDMNQVWSDQVLGFQIKHQNDQICQDLTKGELQFTEELQRNMRKYFTKRIKKQHKFF